EKRPRLGTGQLTPRPRGLITALSTPSRHHPAPAQRGSVVSNSPKSGPSRRDVLKSAGGAVAASALAGVTIPLVHAAESHTIQLALVGCGGRGNGAAEDALMAKNGPTKLVAIADVFKNQLENTANN